MFLREGKYYLSLLLAMLIMTTPVAAQAASLSSMFWWLQPAGNPREVGPSAFLPSIQERLIEKTDAKEEKKIVAGWLTPWGDDSFVSFKANLDAITEVHPFAYVIGADGVSVESSGDWHKEEVMELARAHNIKVIPTISGDVNHSDLMLNDPEKQQAHIKEIIKTIETNNYDGFDIDYEGFLNGYNREVYASFMTDLSKELRSKEKITAIAIEAFNTKQDWETLGKVVDRFMIMGYDYHSARGPEVGPIGPASWLAGVVEYAQTRVPKEKIVLGLGTYGYSWIHNGNQYVSEAVGHTDALQIAAETNSSIERGQDETPFFAYNRGEGQRYLYFEDAASTKPKLALVDMYEIGGIAFWRLGTEDKKIWADVRALNS